MTLRYDHKGRIIDAEIPPADMTAGEIEAVRGVVLDTLMAPDPYGHYPAIMFGDKTAGQFMRTALVRGCRRSSWLSIG